jgi:hypothetical protein
MMDNEEKPSRIGLSVARGQVYEEQLAGHKYLLSSRRSCAAARRDRDESPAARSRLASARFTLAATRRGRPR